MKVDYSTYSGITVDEEGKVYVISGGTPARFWRSRMTVHTTGARITWICAAILHRTVA
jgi:hypothetical protein